jgi:hypothetical protein
MIVPGGLLVKYSQTAASAAQENLLSNTHSYGSYLLYAVFPTPYKLRSHTARAANWSGVAAGSAEKL